MSDKKYTLAERVSSVNRAARVLLSVCRKRVNSSLNCTCERKSVRGRDKRCQTTTQQRTGPRRRAWSASLLRTACLCCCCCCAICASSCAHLHTHAPQVRTKPASTCVHGSLTVRATRAASTLRYSAPSGAAVCICACTGSTECDRRPAPRVIIVDLLSLRDSPCAFALLFC